MCKQLRTEKAMHSHTEKAITKSLIHMKALTEFDPYQGKGNS